LPAAVVEALGLHEGDDIEVVIADERVFGVRRKPGADALIERLRRFRGKLPADFPATLSTLAGICTGR
jgi:antitoxin MazE